MIVKVVKIALHHIRHPEVTAQRPSKDESAEAPGPYPSRLASARTSG